MVLHAYLIPAREADRQRDVAPIVAQANGRLAQHQRVATASWWPDPDFPRTSTLKVRRHLLPLPEAVHAVAIDSTLAADDPVGQAVATVAKVPAVTDAPDARGAGAGQPGAAGPGAGAGGQDRQGGRRAGSDARHDGGPGPRDAGEGARPRRRHRRRTAPRAPSAPAPASRSGRTPGVGSSASLRAPLTLAYQLAVTRTVILGAEHLTNLPPRLILAGTHHAHADEPLVRAALAKTPAAASLSNRLVVAARANAFDTMPKSAAWYAILAFGLYPLRQYGEQDVSLRGLAKLVQQGNPLLIFPQGTPHPSRRRARRRPGGRVQARASATWRRSSTPPCCRSGWPAPRRSCRRTSSRGSWSATRRS